jgi:hypothetical protein
MLKPCSRCYREAEISVVCVVSTVGTRPRRQKCSAVVLFCRRCMVDLLADDGHLWTHDLQKSVNNAYTHVNRPIEDGTDRGIETPAGAPND